MFYPTDRNGRDASPDAALSPVHELTQPLSSVAGRVDGRLSLHFAANRADRTRLTIREQRPPLQMVRAFRQDDGAALGHLHNISGGVLGGDNLALTVTVGPAARAQLTSTGATRVYRRREGSPVAVQRNEVWVAEGGLLEYVPDPLIPFAGAAYHQETRIVLADDAGLFWWEIVAPGRAARGEVFAFECVQTTFDLVANDQPIALERTRLVPQERPLTSLVRLGPYRHSATCYICRVGLAAERWLALETQLNELAQAQSQPGESIWGVSSLPAHGLVVRGLSRTGRPIAPGLLAFWRAAKQDLYGREPISPRKVY